MSETQIGSTDPKSATRRAAELLRRETLARPDNEFLGSESDLLRKFGVSRPTFRQAAKLVEQEQLITIRRGVGGGYFVKHPSCKAVSHMASIYLQTRGATLENAIRAARPLFVETAQEATLNQSPEIRRKLADFLENDAERSASKHLRDFLRSEKEFGQIFAESSGNPVLELCVLMLYDLAASFVLENVYAGRPKRVAAIRPLRNRIFEAILDRDKEVATLMAVRRSDLLISWLIEDRLDAKPTPHAKVG